MNKKLSLAILLAFSTICGRAQEVDQNIGLSVPDDVSRDANSLAAALCIDLTDDQAKATAIYNWVTHNIRYDVEILSQSDPVRDKIVERTLKNRKAGCEGFAMTFTETCKAAGLKAVNIEGYARTQQLNDSDELYIPRHMWSAVSIKGKWQLVDPTWGSGTVTQASQKPKFTAQYDPQYLTQDPETFRIKHLPADPLWQLTDSTMPIRVFEAGDSAVWQFNQRYSRPRQTGRADLDRISGMTDQERIIDHADRANRYNPHYATILALKQTYQAMAIIDKVESDPKQSTAILKDADGNLMRAQEYLQAQKKSITEEYNQLKKKNKVKTQDTKQYVRQITMDDQRIIKDYDKYVTIAAARKDRLQKRKDELKMSAKDVNADKINKIETGKLQKKTDSPELMAINDSIASRKEQMKTMQNAIDQQQKTLDAKRAENSVRLDLLGQGIAFEDSMMVLETNARIEMPTNYNEDISNWNAQLKKQKYLVTDSLHKYYLRNFDTVAALYDDLQKMQDVQLALFKKNIAALEQYKKYNGDDNALGDRYADLVNEYLVFLDVCPETLEAYSGYLDGNRKLFSETGKLFAHQADIAGKIEDAETKRSQLEEQVTDKKQAFDINENDKQREAIKGVQAHAREAARKQH